MAEQPFQMMQRPASWSEVKRIAQAVAKDAGIKTSDLTVFDESIDNYVSKQVDRLSKGVDSTQKYSPLSVEPLLDEISELIVRCAAYRGAIDELEILAIQQTLDAIYFEQSNAAERSLVLASSKEVFYSDMVTALDNAAQKLSKADTPAPLSVVLATLLADSAAGMKVLAAGDRAVTQQRLNQLDFAEQRNRNLSWRYTDPGNSHNHTERYLNLRKLLVEDALEAYLKVKSAVVGLEMAYGTPSDTFRAPDPARKKLLDNLIDWTRNAKRFIEELSQEQLEFTVVVPLVQGWTASDRVRKPILPFALLDQQIKGKSYLDLVFTLPSEIFPDVEYVKLRGVALSFGHDPASIVMQNSVFWAEVKMPNQKLPGGGGLELTGPALSNYTMRSCTRSDHEVVSGLAVRNLSPIGEWRIQIRSLAMTPSRIEQDYVPFAEIFLHLRVVADRTAAVKNVLSRRIATAVELPLPPK